MSGRGFYHLSREGAVKPTYATKHSSGLDLTLVDLLDKSSTDAPHTVWVGTGVHMIPPRGFLYVMAPRSSLSKHGYRLANPPAIIDEDYTGEIIVALDRTVPEATPLEKMLPWKCVQLVLVRNERVSELFEVADLKDFEKKSVSQERLSGGFGSTDSKSKKIWIG